MTAPLVLAILAIIAYSVTSAFYFSALFGEKQPRKSVDGGGMLVSAALNAALVVTLGVLDGVGALVRLGDVFAVLAVVLAAGFTVLNTQFPVRVAGLFVAPTNAILLGLYLLSYGESGAQETSLILGVHIGLAIVGISAFALASFVAILYLLQERQLRQRSFGRLFQRLPSLDALDTANFRLVALGFVVYTVAVLIGIVWAVRIERIGLDGRTFLALVAWLIFAVVIQTRITTGWRGRQAAFLTLAGCISSYVVLFFYLA